LQGTYGFRTVAYHKNYLNKNLKHYCIA